jgi:hypothetical protein
MCPWITASLSHRPGINVRNDCLVMGIVPTWLSSSSASPAGWRAAWIRSHSVGVKLRNEVGRRSGGPAGESVLWVRLDTVEAVSSGAWEEETDRALSRAVRWWVGTV